MKATGIVRRIDELGRVVIPKEIRRTMRIRVGDPLEIFTDNNGSVIFKKYSPIVELGNFASLYVDVLQKASGHAVIISDQDYLVAAAGLTRRDVSQMRVSSGLEPVIEAKKLYVYKEDSQKKVYPAEGIDQYVLASAPVLVDNDMVGVMMMLTDRSTEVISDADLKLLQASAGILGKQMEE